jgi:hypothetical protein
MNDGDKWEFLKERALPRMTDFTFPFIASIFGIHDGHQGSHQGTALRCVLGGRRYIATAFHVLKRAIQQFDGQLAVSTESGCPPYQLEGQIIPDRDADLAILALPDDYPSESDRIAFWPEERIDAAGEKRSTDYLFLQGFPCILSNTKESSPFDISNRSFPYGAMEYIEAEGRPSTLDPNQFAIHFREADMLPIAPYWSFQREGLSGSPVWRLGLSGSQASRWSPEDCRLVGILTKHSGDPGPGGKDFLIATDIAALMSLTRS